MDMRKVGEDFKVCLCREVTKKEIIEQIRENNITTLAELRNKLNIGNVCGGCGEDLEELIKIAYEKK